MAAERRPRLLGAAQAIEEIAGGEVGVLAVGGMHMHNNPMALVREVARQEVRIRRLLTSPSACLNADLLIGAGLVEEVATSYVGFEHLGLAPAFRRAAENGTLRVLELDEPSITHGLYAAAGGLPFAALPPRLDESDVNRADPDLYSFTMDPFSGERVLCVRPLRPDVAVIHASVADRRGNCAFEGAFFTDRLMGLAARKLIVQVERIVAADVVAAQPAGTTLPGFLVSAVVEAPGGCLPTASHGNYGYDEPALKAYLAEAKTPEVARA